MQKVNFSVFKRCATRLVVVMATVSAAISAQAVLIIQPNSQVAQNPSSAIQSSGNQFPILAINQPIMPSDASIEKLIKVLHVDTTIDAVIAQQKQINEQISKFPNMGTPPNATGWGLKKWENKKQIAIQQVLGKYSKVLVQENDPVVQRQKMLDAYKVAAKNHYTQAEVDAQIAFYDTPMGQQIVQKQSLVNQDYLEGIMPAVLGDTPANLEKMLPQLQQDMQKIFE